MTWYMRIGTGVRPPAGATTPADAPEADRLVPLVGLRASAAGAFRSLSTSCARTDAGAATVKPNTSVAKEAASAVATEHVLGVVMPGTVGEASNRPATGD